MGAARERDLARGLFALSSAGMRQVAILFTVLILAAFPAAGDPAEDAFAAGRYMEAAGLAEAAGGPDNLAKAARCVLADEVVSGALDPAALDKAETLARSALKEDEDHVEARLQLAIALSLKSRLMSTSDVLKAGYGSEGRDLARSVLEDDPGNAYAHGFLSVWNVEVVRKGGRLGAAWFGAGLGAAREHFEAALASDPQNPALCWQYARALAAQDYRKHYEEVFDALRCSLETKADTELDRVMQDRARSFWAYARGHSRQEIEERAADLL